MSWPHSVPPTARPLRRHGLLVVLARWVAFFSGWLAAIAVPAADEAIRSGWHRTRLWQSEVLSAHVRTRSPASLADDPLLVLEFENHTPEVLKIEQAFMNLDGDRRLADTGELRSSGGVASGVVYFGFVRPGVTTASGDVCGAASLSLGLPPPQGYRVDLTLRCEVRLADGRTFATPASGVPFRLDWRVPTRDEESRMRETLRTLLAVPQRAPVQELRIQTLLLDPAVADSLTVDDVLQHGLTGEIARRFTNDPKVVAAYSARLGRGEREVLGELGRANLWNPAWIDPLVVRFERDGDSQVLSILGWHRDDWIRDRTVQRRLSTALLRHRPVLSRDLGALTEAERFAWCGAAHEAALVGDPALLPRFIPGLDDPRLARHPNEARLASIPNRDRICDASLLAVLTFLDGSPVPGLREAGATDGTWPMDVVQRQPLFDRAIARLQRRLAESSEVPKAP